jgi:hypothetical protein
MVWYATREQVMRSLEITGTSRSRRIIDDKLEAASRAVEGQLHRRFYPELKTVTFDYPNDSFAPTWQLQLGDNELISVSALSSGGTAIVSGNYILRRWDDKDEPPYTLLEINLAGTAAFSAGTTFQRAISVTGVFGGDRDTSTAQAAAVVATNINSTLTTLVLKPASGAFDVGVGSLLLIGTERLFVTGRSMSDTGVNIGIALASRQSDNAFGGTLFAEDELLLIDAERMRISDIAGNTLIVERAWDGSDLASHSLGADIYAQRTFRVDRGVLGSTAAAHTTIDSVYVHKYPGLINELCVAEAMVALEQNASAYARTVGSGDNQRESSGKGLEDLRKQAWIAYGRKERSGAI